MNPEDLARGIVLDIDADLYALQIEKIAKALRKYGETCVKADRQRMHREPSMERIKEAKRFAHQEGFAAAREKASDICWQDNQLALAQRIRTMEADK
jgi:hypothetical protein